MLSFPGKISFQQYKSMWLWRIKLWHQSAPAWRWDILHVYMHKSRCTQNISRDSEWVLSSVRQFQKQLSYLCMCFTSTYLPYASWCRLFQGNKVTFSFRIWCSLSALWRVLTQSPTLEQTSFCQQKWASCAALLCQVCLLVVVELLAGNSAIESSAECEA